MAQGSNSKQKKNREAEIQVNDVSREDEDEVFDEEEGGYRVDGIYIPPPLQTTSFVSTGNRLVITKITNNFFKSYADNQVLGPFHKCFNAIVGPNGSGKSNVIDSMLFVFGYRATKIRCKKVSVLIHNSEKYTNVRSCTVAVHFALIIDKEGEDYEIVPGSEFVISRTANKDNSSFYELNGKRVQFKEVAILLKKHGIDLDHNRFLILQGEVEQIAMMKCKADNDNESGMLEYLEDIIGTSRYKKPLCQVYDRVEFLAERRMEKLNRLKLVEKELDELKAPMEEAVGFLKTENTVVTSKNFIYQKQIHDLHSAMNTEEENRKDVLEIQNGFIEKLNKLTETKKEKEKVLNKESAIYENLKKKKDSIKEAFDKANKKDIQLQEDMTNKNKNRKATKELLAEERKKLEKLENMPKENEKKIEECEAKLEEMAAKKERLEGEKAVLLQNIQKETKGLQDKKADIQKDLAVLNEAVDKTKSDFNLAETELKVYVSSEENERLKLENLQKASETAKQTIAERKQQISQLKKKIPGTEKSLNDAKKDFDKCKQEETQIVNEMRSKRLSFEETRNNLQASKSQGRVLDSLMRAKGEGKCPGLFGRLGDLGAIDKKYDVAVSTACGPLDNIVVDTVDCAQWCIEFLKTHDIGRAVFIALDKQEHLRHVANSKIQTPENVPRLYDLIKVQDERVKTAFYYALRDTLVADNLDQASRIAYGAKRYRVVTLKGDLIETTGTMSGGGKTVMRGRMGQSVAVSSVNPEDLKRMERDLQTMEERVGELRQRQASLEGQINTLQPELRQMKIDYEKFTKELQSLEQQQPQLARHLQEQEAKSRAVRADPTRVKKLTEIMEDKRSKYEEALETAGALQIQVDKLTKEIHDKSAGKIRVVDKEINDAKQIIDKCKSQITKLRVAIKTAERNYKTSTENIRNMEQDIVDMENSLRAMKEERLEIESDARKLLICVEEITEQLEGKEKIYTDVQKEVAEISKKEKALKLEKIDIDEKVKTSERKLNDLKGKIHTWEVKLAHLKLQDIPNETVEELKKYTPEELGNRNAESVEKELQAAENFLKVAKPNLSAIEEYRKKQTVFMERTKELEEISCKRAEMRKLFDNLRKQRKDEFMSGYNIIRMKLKEIYQMITLGGDADFELVDSYDPFTEGIQFNVRPPKKSWKKISNLSGGEKTLSSLALVFAIHHYKASPLYVMDEIDAALDFKNVSIVGHYIKERTKDAQFIIISLRSNMFELCDRLIGIYKTYNCTKSATINPKAFGGNDQPPPTGAPTNCSDQPATLVAITQGDRNDENNSRVASSNNKEDENEQITNEVQVENSSSESQCDDVQMDSSGSQSVFISSGHETYNSSESDGMEVTYN